MKFKQYSIRLDMNDLHYGDRYPDNCTGIPIQVAATHLKIRGPF